MIFLDRVSEMAETVGTGPITLLGAVPGFRTFAEGLGGAPGKVFYFMRGWPGTADEHVWEFGWGDLTPGVTDTLTRNLIVSSTGSFIAWVPGDKVIMSTPIAEVWNSLMQFHAGTSRPPWLPENSIWLDRTGGPTAVLLKFYDGADDILIGTFDETANTYLCSNPGTPGPPGPPGPQGPSGQSAGRIFYFWPSDASDIATYKTLGESPAPGAEVTVNSVCTGTGDVAVGSFITEPGVPGEVPWPAGTVFRRIFASVSAGSGRLHVEVYKREAGGTETLVRSEFSPAFTNTTAILQDWTVTLPYPGVAMTATDRLVCKVYAQRVSGPASITVSTYYEGVYGSHIQTTISAGAQGPPGPPGADALQPAWTLDTPITVSAPGTFTITSAHNQRTIQVTVAGVTIAADVTAMPDNFCVTITNKTAAHGFIGRGTRIALTGARDYWLYNEQTTILYRVAGSDQWRSIRDHRYKCISDVELYAAPGGSDLNDGLNVAAPVPLTALWQRAMTELDFNGRSIVINMADGGHGSLDIHAQWNWVGGGILWFRGNTSNYGLVNLEGNGAFIDGAKSGRLIIEWLTTPTINASDFARVEFSNIGLWPAPPTGVHLTATRHGILTATGNYVINSSAVKHVAGHTRGLVEVVGKTIGMAVAPSWSFVCAEAWGMGMVDYTGSTFSGPGLGGATGQRYMAAWNAFIHTGGAGANFFPGNSAGATLGGGEYV